MPPRLQISACTRRHNLRDRPCVATQRVSLHFHLYDCAVRAPRGRGLCHLLPLTATRCQSGLAPRVGWFRNPVFTEDMRFSRKDEVKSDVAVWRQGLVASQCFSIRPAGLEPAGCFPASRSLRASLRHWIALKYARQDLNLQAAFRRRDPFGPRSATGSLSNTPGRT
jgi:hypothetical protein